MNWIEVDFREVVLRVKDRLKEFTKCDLPFIGFEHIEKESLRIIGTGRTDGLTSEKTIFQPGDILFGTLRPYFRKVVVPKFSGVCSTDITVLRTKDETKLNQKFLFYFIANPSFIKYASNFAKDQRPRVYWDQLFNGNTLVPPLPTQKKIASILSAFDDLIENNLKRIKLLEEAAELLYKEWFVDFRFPGWQSTKFIDGLPEGWDMKAFSEVANFVNGFAFKPSDWKLTGLPIIKISELKNGIQLKTPRNDGEGIAEKYFIYDDDVLFSWSADIDVYWWVKGKAILNQHLFKVIPETSVQKCFLFWALKNSIEAFKTKTVGTTMRHIRKSALDEVKTLLPTSDIQNKFANHVERIIRKQLTLQKQIELMVESRDQLLPKLMSGEIKV